MITSKLAATLAVIAAFIVAPSIAAAAPSPLRGHASKNEISIETIERAAMFSGDAYDNEMGLRAPGWLPEVDDEVL